MTGTYLSRLLRHIGMTCLACGMLFSVTQAQAWSIRVWETDKAEFGDTLQWFDVDNLVTKDAQGEPILNLQPDKVDAHRKLIELLLPGMPIDQKPVQRDIAKILAGFPRQCEATYKILATVAPIEGIDKWIPGVTDKRRIYYINVINCLENMPSECSNCLCDTGGIDFGINSLSGFLQRCSDALHRGIEAGKPFDEEVLKRNTKGTAR